ncbi:MAG: hypothetical protein ACK4M8_02145 [Allorhizobium sp.]
MSKRTYRREASVELLRIEEKRLELKISHEDLYLAAGVTRATYYAMRSDQVAFPRNLQALRYGLRTLEQRQRNAERILEGEA